MGNFISFIKKLISSENKPLDEPVKSTINKNDQQNLEKLKNEKDKKNMNINIVFEEIMDIKDLQIIKISESL